jgi:hypothetical protein
LFQWSGVPSATSYHIVITLNSGYVVDSATVSGTSFQIPGGLLVVNTYYFWKVYAANSNGIGPWSITSNFCTVTSPPSPVLI